MESNLFIFLKQFIFIYAYFFLKKVTEKQRFLLLVKRKVFLDVPQFVVAPEQQHPIGRQIFLREKVGHHFHAERTAVHVVPQEEERSGSQDGAHAPEHFLKAQQITVIPMDITWKTSKQKKYHQSSINRINILFSNEYSGWEMETTVDLIKNREQIPFTINRTENEKKDECFRNGE